MDPLFIRACRGEATERAPVWIMRQAGRYLPEYRKIREKTTFLKLCKTPELATEVTLQPVEILGVDAAIIFSDILIIPEAMGQTLTIEEKQGPRLTPPIDNAEDIQRLKTPSPEKAYDFLGKALQMTRKSLLPEIPLIGFAGSPWTLLTYMVEGASGSDFKKAKNLIKNHPKMAHSLLTKLTQAVTDLLWFQIENGAQVVQIFDSWGGILEKDDFFEFSIHYVEQIIANLKSKETPLIFFAKGTGQYLERIQHCGANVIGLDWTVDLKSARNFVKDGVALQGNLDPQILLTDPARIREAIEELFSGFNPRKGYIFNLGHGILPQTPVENAKDLVEVVGELSAIA